MKKGQIIMIYKDPLTKTQEEGKAKLLRRIRQDETFETWRVHFIEDTPYMNCDRKILKEKNNG